MTELFLTVYRSEEVPAGTRERAFQHEVGRLLLRAAFSRRFAQPFPEIKVSPSGKPYFVGHPAQFSLSHCRGAVCCGLSDQAVGVDVERVRPQAARVAPRVCAPEELHRLEGCDDRDGAFTALWTLKESRMKLHGEGFSFGARNAVFRFDAAGKPIPAEPGLRAALYRPEPDLYMALCAMELPEQFLTIEMEYLRSFPHTYC